MTNEYSAEDHMSAEKLASESTYEQLNEQERRLQRRYCLRVPFGFIAVTSLFFIGFAGLYSRASQQFMVLTFAVSFSVFLLLTRRLQRKQGVIILARRIRRHGMFPRKQEGEIEHVKG